jgi:hypothetical protein
MIKKISFREHSPHTINILNLQFKLVRVSSISILLFCCCRGFNNSKKSYEKGSEREELMKEKYKKINNILRGQKASFLFHWSFIYLFFIFGEKKKVAMELRKSGFVGDEALI